MTSDFDASRRAYLATVGAAGVAGLAGCPAGGGNGAGDGDGNGNGDDGGIGTGNGSDDGGTETDDVVVPATAADFPPFEYTDDGVLVGLDVELAETVIERAGFEVGSWVDIRFDALLGELNAGQFDLVTAATTTGLGRGEEVAFTTTYYETDQAVLVGSAGSFQPTEEADLEGRIVGAQSGTTSEAEANRLVEAGVLASEGYRQYVDFPPAADALETEELDAVFVDRRVGEAVAADREVEIAFEIGTEEQYALATRQDDERLEALDQALTEIVEDGTFDDLRAEHLG